LIVKPPREADRVLGSESANGTLFSSIPGEAIRLVEQVEKLHIRL